MTNDMPSDVWFDANGCLTERVSFGGQEVIVHYDDIPESDITTIDGLRVTTALRTVIDLALDLDRGELETVVRDCLDRGLFTAEEVEIRTSEPDMVSRRGARPLRKVLNDLGEAG